jgi:(+)-pinoresinol hydroxylase
MGSVLSNLAARAAEPPADAPGAAVYRRWCVPCHGAGPDKPGTGALQEKYHGKRPAQLEQRSDLSAEFVRQIVRQGVSVMPPFRKTEISDTELAALAAYLSHHSKPEVAH